MKKLISLLLAFVMVAAMAAGCSIEKDSKDETEGTKETTGTTKAPTEPIAAGPESALEILETVWASYAEEEMFMATGGDSAYHIAQMEKDETYMAPSAPGKFNLSETDELIFQKLVPETEISKITDAATLTHMMSNNFSGGVYRMAAADTEAFIAAMKDAVNGNMWMCGMPESLLIATVADEYVLVAWGVNDIMSVFESKFVAAYPDAKLVVDEAIAG